MRITGKARRLSKGQALDDLIPEEVMRAVGGIPSLAIGLTLEEKLGEDASLGTHGSLS